MKEIEKLYLFYKDDVYRYLLSLTQDPNLSEDLLSDTFVSAIISIGSFKGQSSIKTWLFSIARNTWLQGLRKKRKTVEYNDLLGLYISCTMDDKLIDKEKVERIKDLLREKDDRTQKVVAMRIEGYSFKEIAKKVNISESSARVINFRTKRWIKSVLEREGLS